MVPSDLLLQLIAHLQSDDSVAHGRRALLDYLRKSTGASLGLIFVLHRGDHVLTLLERCGRRPRHPARSRPDSIELPRKEIFESEIRRPYLASSFAACLAPGRLFDRERYHRLLSLRRDVVARIGMRLLNSTSPPSPPVS